MYQHNNDLPKLGRQNFMVKVVEGLIGGFREQHNRLVPKIKYAPNRFIECRETFQTNEVGKMKRKTVLSAGMIKSMLYF